MLKFALLIYYLPFIHIRSIFGNVFLETTRRMVKDVDTVCVVNGKTSDEFGKLMIFLANENVTFMISDLNPIKNERRCTMNLVVVEEKEAMLELLRSELKFLTTHSRVLMIAINVHDFDFGLFYNICLKNDLDLLVITRNSRMDIFHASNILSSDVMLYKVLEKRNILVQNHVLLNLTKVLERPKWNLVNTVKELNVTFNVLAYARTPYIKDADEHLSGFDVELVKLILEDVPLSFEVIKQTNDPFLYMNERLGNGTSELNIGAIWLVNKPRKFRIQTTTPYYQQCLKFVVHKPVLLPESTFMFQYFDLTLWLFLMVVVGVLAILLAILEKMVRSRFPLGESLTVTISVLIGGSFEGTLSRTLAMHTVILFWSLGSLWIVTYCNAGLTTLMQLPRFHLDVRTFEDMLERKIHWFFKIAAMRESVRSLGGIYAEIGDLFLHSNDREYINRMMRTGRFGMIVESLPGRFLVNMDVLDGYSRRHLKVVNECFLKNYLSFNTPYNSLYYDYINKKILQVVSNGFDDILMRRMVDREQRKASELFYSSYSGEANTILNLSKMQGAFWMLLIGWSVGFVLWFWRLWKRRMITKLVEM